MEGNRWYAGVRKLKGQPHRLSYGLGCGGRRVISVGVGVNNAVAAVAVVGAEEKVFMVLVTLQLFLVVEAPVVLVVIVETVIAYD